MTTPANGPAGDATRKLAAFAALVAGACAMGASPVFVRMADVGPFASAFWRAALALPALWLWAVIEARSIAPEKARAGFTLPVILAGVFFAGDLFFWHLAILGTTVANATFLSTTAPIWVVLGAWFLLRQTIDRGTILGLVACLAGGVMLVGQSYAYAPQRLWGDAYGLITAVFFGAYFLSIRAGRETHGSARLVFLSTAITAAILLVVALALEPRLLPASAEGWATLLALALVSQVAGQGLLAVALGHLPAVFSSLVIFVEAVAAAAFGWVFLGESLTTLQLLGGILIFAGIWVARPRPAQPTKDTP